jgi:hypothetical protein
MIFFCEINKTGQEHVMINSCLLKILYLANQPDKLQVWADRLHLQHFIDKPEDLSYRYQNVIEPQKSNKFRWVAKLISEIVTILRIVISASRQNVKLVFFSSLSPVGNWILALIAPLVQNKIKFVVVMHGEMELAKTENRKKKIEQLYGNGLVNAFNKVRINIKYLILSEVIASNILDYKILRKEQMITMEHPYIFKNEGSSINIKHSQPIVFGHFGVAKLNKQSELFFALADRYKELVNQGILKFQIIGQVFDELIPFTNEYVSYKKDDAFISRTEYDSLASEIDYALFLYDEKAYEFTSSGAVLDAISYEKPIISFNTKPFLYLKNNSNCVQGYMYENFEQMSNSILNIISAHQAVYLDMSNCMRIHKKFYTIEAQYPLFKEQLDQYLNN